MILNSKKNTLLILAAALVVAFGFMALSTIQKRKVAKEKTFESEIMQIETQSESDEITEIEKDLLDTDLSSLDKELLDIEKEIETAY